MLNSNEFKCTGREAAWQAGNVKPEPFTWSELAGEVDRVWEWYEEEGDLDFAIYLVAKQLCEVDGVGEHWMDWVIEGFNTLIKDNL